MDDLTLIKERINIVDLVSEYLTLKKAGINFKAPCPFHKEKTPSFIVSPERQIFKCFGCNVGGDIFKFLMEKEGLDFKESLEILAKKAGVTLHRADYKKDIKEKLLEVNLKAQEFFHYILVKHKLGKKALAYLQNRGITDSSVEQFGIGYAPNSWQSLTKFLLKRGYQSTDIIQAGLGVASGNFCYDRFRGRVTFPLYDTKERILGFSGRVLQPAEPKYINSPQTAIFDKSNFLFGINLAKGEIRTKNEAILVEGEMDMILSFQSGVKNIVASKGTALTEGQINLIKKFTENISLCFDTDLAGDLAARRGIEMADKAGLNIKVIQVKEGKDPAEIIKNDPRLWQEAAAGAAPIYDFYLEFMAKRYNIKTAEGIKKISSELIPIWSRISDDLVREHYIQKLSALLRSDEKIIREAVAGQRKGTWQMIHQAGQKDDMILEVRSRRHLLEEYLMALLLRIPKDHIYVPTFPETLLTNEILKQVYILLVLYLDSISFKGKSFDINEFSKDLPKELIQETDRLYLIDLDEKLALKGYWQKEVETVVLELKKALIKASLEKLSYEIKNAQHFGKIELVDNLNKRFRDLSVKLKNL